MNPISTDTYLITDVHGCVREFRALADWMLAEIKANPDPIRKRRLVVLGDLGDRGPDAKGVLDLLVRLKEDDNGLDYVDLILGNHDWWLLQAATERNAELRDWVRPNGGDATLKSYGVDPGQFGRIPAGDLLDQIRAAVPQSHKDLLAGARRWIRFGDVVCVHAGLVRGVDLSCQSDHSLMWDRAMLYDNETDDGLFVIHGHTPVKKAYVAYNRMGLDTGCFATGNLTMAVIDTTGWTRWVVARGGSPTGQYDEVVVDTWGDAAPELLLEFGGRDVRDFVDDSRPFEKFEWHPEPTYSAKGNDARS